MGLFGETESHGNGGATPAGNGFVLPRGWPVGGEPGMGSFGQGEGCGAGVAGRRSAVNGFVWSHGKLRQL